MITDDDLDAIETRARAATPGPWMSHEPRGRWAISRQGQRVAYDMQEVGIQIAPGMREHDAAHIAGMHPGVTLAIIARVRSETARAEAAEAMLAPMLCGHPRIVEQTEQIGTKAPRRRCMRCEDQQAREEAEAERDDARGWVRRLTATERVLTCAFCGEAYPPGTPESNDVVLLAHVKVCTKHPMREAEAERDRLRAMLAPVQNAARAYAADGVSLGSAQVLTAALATLPTGVYLYTEAPAHDCSGGAKHGGVRDPECAGCLAMTRAEEHERAARLVDQT